MHRRAQTQAQAARCIDERSGFVVLDFRGCSSHELSEIYQAFALLCVRAKVRCALLRTGDEDADAHYTLRDILATLARIADVPLGLRLALVAHPGPIDSVFGDLQKELASLGCEARLFRTERLADDWLRADGSHARRPPVAALAA